MARHGVSRLGARRSIALAAIALGMVPSAAHAQRFVADIAEIPDAPSAIASAADPQATPEQKTPTQQTTTGPVNDSGQPKQTKRILGIVPNFRAVSADQKLPPQSAKEKLTSTFQQSFDYSAFILPAILAGDAQASNSEPQFHQGAAGYARYYWHSFADQTNENFWVQAILPIALRQDSRYYTLGHGGVVKRASYAFSRIFITRTDSDGETFNASEIVGAGAASGISTLYYPSADRTWTKTGQRWLVNVGIDGGVFMFQEFWPNINNALFHQKD